MKFTLLLSCLDEIKQVIFRELCKAILYCLTGDPPDLFDGPLYPVLMLIV